MQRSFLDFLTFSSSWTSTPESLVWFLVWGLLFSVSDPVEQVKQKQNSNSAEPQS